MKSRLQKCYRAIKERKLDAFFVRNIHNVRYLTGFTGSTGYVILIPGATFFITDSRYAEQARVEVRDCTIHVLKGRLYADVQKIFNTEVFKKNSHKKTGIYRIGFESTVETIESLQQLKKATAGNAECIPEEGIIEQLRIVKSKTELMILQKAIDIAEEALLKTLAYVKPGVYERDIAIELEYLMRRCGADDKAFHTIVASGAHAALPHAQPRAVAVKNGDMLLIDFGCVYQGYRSDITRTFFIGKTSAAWRRKYNAVRDAADNAFLQLHAGVSGRDMHHTAQEVLRKNKLKKYFTHSLGHGVGLEVHEAPSLAERYDHAIPENAVVTIEPGVYLPGKGGIRIEDMVVVGEKKSIRLTTFPRELIIL